MTRDTLSLLGVVVLVASCVRPGPEGEGVPPVTAPPAETAPADPTAQALAAHERDLAARQYRPEGSPERARVEAGGTIAFAVEARTGLCYVASAHAVDPAVDLDLFVIDPDGATLARHEAPPTSGAVVGFCPTRPGRHSVHVHAYAGAGDLAFARWVGTAPLADLEELFGAASARDGAAETLDPSVASRVERRDRELAPEGLRRAGPPSTATFGRGETRSVPAVLTSGACYAFIALSGGSEQDVDLALFAPGGQRLVRDDRGASSATLRHCAIVAGAHALEVKLADGSGPVWLLVYVRGADPGREVTSLSSAHGPAGERPPVSDAARRGLDHELRARGYELDGPDETATAQAGATQTHEVTLEGGRCWAVAAAGELPAGEVDLAARERTAELGRDRGRFAMVRLCPTRTTSVGIEVRTAATGRYWLSRWRWPRSMRGPFGLEGSIFVRLSEATSLLGLDGLEPLAAPILVDLREGVVQRAELPVAPGACIAVVAAAGPEVRELQLSMLADRTALATAAPRGPLAIARTCVQPGGRHQLELRSGGGSGRALHQLFGRPVPSGGP